MVTMQVEGGAVNYRHTMWGTVLLSITLFGGIVALLFADKDVAAVITFGGVVIQGMMTLIVSKGVDDVKHQVNGNTSALIAKLPDPVPEPTNADGSPFTAWQREHYGLDRRQSVAGAPADVTVVIPDIPADPGVRLAQSVVDFQALYGPKCAAPGCIRPRGHVGDDGH